MKLVLFGLASGKASVHLVYQTITYDVVTVSQIIGTDIQNTTDIRWHSKIIWQSLKILECTKGHHTSTWQKITCTYYNEHVSMTSTEACDCVSTKFWQLDEHKTKGYQLKAPSYQAEKFTFKFISGAQFMFPKHSHHATLLIAQGIYGKGKIPLMHALFYRIYVTCTASQHSVGGTMPNVLRTNSFLRYVIDFQ